MSSWAISITNVMVKLDEKNFHNQNRNSKLAEQKLWAWSLLKGYPLRIRCKKSQYMYVFSNSQRTMSMDAYWGSGRLWQYKPNRLRMWLNRFENRCKDDESTKFYNWHFIGSDSTLTKMQKMIDCCQSSWSYQKFNTFFVHSWYVSYNI